MEKNRIESRHYFQIKNKVKAAVGSEEMDISKSRFILCRGE